MLAKVKACGIIEDEGALEGNGDDEKILWAKERELDTKINHPRRAFKVARRCA